MEKSDGYILIIKNICIPLIKFKCISIIFYIYVCGYENDIFKFLAWRTIFIEEIFTSVDILLNSSRRNN